jgi:hypothetical protein
MGRDVLNAAVQPMGEGPVLSRRAVVLQAAAGKQFIEAIKPAEASQPGKVDVGGVNRPIADG